MSHQKPKLVFLNRCYWPDSEATGQLLTDLCESLATDFDVHVVCGQPNSPTTDRYIERGVELKNGVTIHRLAHTRFAKRIPAGRSMNLISFSNSCNNYLRRSRLPADILICETDPFLLPIVAARHSRRVGSKLVCYLQDIYPDVAEAIGKVRSGWLTEMIRRQLQSAYRVADRIVVLGSCMQDRLQASPWCLDPDKVTVVPNWADCSKIRPEDSPSNALLMCERLTDRFVVMHSGNMGLTQRLDVLVSATKSSHWPGNAVLLLVGDGAARADLQSQIAEDRSGRVRILPYQPRSELSTSLSAADLHVVSMHERISGCLCPSKLYGILAAGRPVLAIAAAETDLCRTVAQHDLGWCCMPGDAEAIAKCVAMAAENREQLLSAGQKARSLASRQFDRIVVIGQFKEMLISTLKETVAARSSQKSDNVVALNTFQGTNARVHS